MSCPYPPDNSDMPSSLRTSWGLACPPVLPPNRKHPLFRQVHALAWPRLEQTAFYDAPFLLTTLHAVSAATRSFVLAGDGAFGFTFLASHVRSMIA